MPLVVLTSALFVLITTNLISYVFFRHIPHVNDEMGYLFQAKIFGQGRLYVPSPCGQEAFTFAHVINNGRWYSQYPPGFPLLLLFGLAVGAPWLVNPLLAFLSVFVFYFLGKEIYGEAAGRLAAVLGAASIWLILTSSTMLSHTASMLCFSIFLLFLFKSLKVPSLVNGLAAGFGLGAAFLIRPYNAVAVSVPLVLYYGLRFIRGPRARLRNALGFFAILVAAVACLLIYNQLTNGHPLKMGYIVKYGEGHGIGFGRSGYTDTPHTPGRGAFLVGKNLEAINKYLFGWPLSSLLFLVPFVIPVKGERKTHIPDLLLVASFISLAAALFLYWGSFVLLGARMFFEGLPLLILMSARGILKTPAIVSTRFPRVRAAAVRKALACAIGLFSVFAYTFTFPRWLRPPYSRSPNEYLVNDFRAVTERIHGTMRQLSLGKSLIIMKFLYSPRRDIPDALWGSGFLHNDPLLRNEIIYAQDVGASNVGLLGCFPERRAFLFTGTVEKGMLFPLRIADGRLAYGEPFVFRSGDARFIDLIGRPQEMFSGYSAGYQDYLAALFAARRLFETDVTRLSDLSLSAEGSGDLVQAAYHLESALQIENDPDVRFLLLGRLAILYTRTGRRTEAEQIIERLHGPHEPRVYGVFPHRGF